MKDVYLIFHSNLQKERKKIYISSIVNIVTFLTDYYSPPFSHVKLAFLENKGRYSHFEAFYFNYEDGFCRRESKYVNNNGYSFLKLNMSNKQKQNLYEFVMEFYLSEIRRTFSLWKMSQFTNKIRNCFCLSEVTYPAKDESKWFCSEFVSYCLLECGYFKDFAFHPSYISPTTLFLLVVFNEGKNINEKEVHPLLIYEPNKNLINENSIKFYLKFICP
jgi:hypothetical protein